MKNFKLILSAIALVITSASFGYSAELTSTNTLLAPPTGQASQGTVVGVNPDGTIVVVDQETGTIFIVTAAGLNVNISMGETLMYILIMTPNGNEIIKQIKRRA
jgi:DNA-binding beta-propeller fold protein YncE